MLHMGDWQDTGINRHSVTLHRSKGNPVAKQCNRELGGKEVKQRGRESLVVTSVVFFLL